jgi:hypothetical protein
VYVIKTRRDKSGEKSNGVGWNRELEVGLGGRGEISFESRNGTKEKGNGRMFVLIIGLPHNVETT